MTARLDSRPVPRLAGHADLIAHAHARSATHGLRRQDAPDLDRLPRSELELRREQHRTLLRQATPVMTELCRQLAGTRCMAVLSGPDGLLLHADGDARFLRRSEQVALQPGADWSEGRKGTNAIGTALATGTPLVVGGPEHFLDANRFLVCACAPIEDADGTLLGALDVSGDASSSGLHPLTPVQTAVLQMEHCLFLARHADAVCLAVDDRPQRLGTPAEGLLAFTPDGRGLAMNRAARRLFGLHPRALPPAFADLFDAGCEPEAALPHATESRTVRGRDGCDWLVRRYPAPAPVVRPPAVEPVAGRALSALQSGDPVINAAIGKLKRVLGKQVAVVLSGETGTGKELFARAIHDDTPGRDGPFVAVNCAAIPEALIEAELFGYEEGAFTGARRKGSIGKLLQADRGTLFLDEIGDMPTSLQARLLRVLQERAVTPLGSTRTLPTDFMLVCATHRDLRAMVDDGSFRADLYYRLNGLTIRLPALRERVDLAALIGRMLGAGTTTPPSRLSDAAAALLLGHDWPGNLRELATVLHTARCLADDGLIDVEHLPDELTTRPRLPPAATAVRLCEHQDRLVADTLERLGGNISAAARALGISRNRLYRQLARAR